MRHACSGAGGRYVLSSIYLQLTLVDVDAGLREIVAPKTGLAGARVAAHGVDALLVAAARVLELPALVDVDAAAIPHVSCAVDALLTAARRRQRRGRRLPGDRRGRRRAAVTTRLVVANLIAARVQPLRALVYIYSFEWNMRLSVRNGVKLVKSLFVLSKLFCKFSLFVKSI